MPVYYNYRTHVQDLGLQGIFTLNNIRFHKQKTGMVIYGGVGIGGTIYDTRVNALNGTTPYDFTRITNSGYSNRKDIRSQLKTLMDKSYESKAEANPNDPKVFGQVFKPSGSVMKFLFN